MTNDLTAQHLEAIINNTHLEYEQDSAMVVGNPKAATSCAVITVEHIGKALVWAARSEWKYQQPYNIWYNAPLEREATTDELINLYFEHLNKKQ